MVESDFQFGNAGFLTQTGLQLSQNALGILPNRAKFVHLIIVARRDDAAILQGGRGLWINGRINAGLDVVQGVNLSRELSQFGTAATVGQLFQIGQTVKGLSHGIDFLGCCRAVNGPGHQPLDIGNIAERFGQLAACYRMFHQALDCIEPVVDDLAGNQWLFQPAPQQALAHGSGSFIQDPEQSSPLFPAPHGLGQLQVRAGHIGQVHILGFGVADDRFEAADALDLGVMQVLQQTPHGVFYQTILANFGGIGPVPSELFCQGGVDETRGVPLVFHQLDSTVHIFFDVVGHFPTGKHAGIHQYLAGMIAAKLGDHRQADLGVGKLCDMSGTRGDIRKANTCLFPFQVETGNVVVAVILKHAALNDGTWRHHPDDIPFDQALGGGRVLHLLADGYLIALGNQPGHIGLVAVERHAAHGSPLFLAALLAGQGQIQFPGSRDGVVIEHLIEIADAIKEDLILMLLFDIQILFHHGRQIRHGIPLLSWMRSAPVPQ